MAATKLLFITGAFPPMCVGEADHAFQLCHRLAERGLDVHVLTTRGGTETAHTTFTVHPIMRDWSWSDLPRFITFLKRCSPDVIMLMYIGFIYNEHPMVTFAPAISKTVLHAALFATQFENIYGANPQSTTFLARVLRKGIMLWLGRKRTNYYFGTLLHDSDRIITLSNHHLAELCKLAPDLEKKSVVIPVPPLMGVNSGNEGTLRERGRNLLKVKSEDFVITYFGRIYPDKGIDTLLRAFQLVATHRCNVRLVLVGGHIYSGRYQHFRSFADEIVQLPTDLGIADKVTWTGEYAWDSELPLMYLRASDLCVLPYRFGVQLNNSSFSAAASQGLPIITTQGETIDEPFRHKENVYLCQPEDPNVLASAIETLLDGPDLRERLAYGALKLAQERFSWESVIDRTIKTFS
jgi:glycosyltransferase involved in cell wall biosynthesis